MLAGLQRSLPLVLVLTFVLVPSTATRIFKTFLCEPFEYDRNLTKRFLHDDKNIDCDSEEYSSTWTTALVLIVVWPVGVPVLYVVLLWASSDAFFSETQTPLSRATAFLWGDYEAGAFYWEPLEMIRKLTLTGAVLLIGEESEQARVLVALLVSIAFLTLLVAMKPLRRCGGCAAMCA